MSEFLTIAGSERIPVAGAQILEPVSDRGRVFVGIRLHPRTTLPELDSIYSRPLSDRHYLSRREFAQHHGADPEQLQAIVELVQRSGLFVLEKSLAKRLVIIYGPLDRLRLLFELELNSALLKTAAFRMRTGPLLALPEIFERAQGVFGFDNRPEFHQDAVISGSPVFRPDMVINRVRARYGFPDHYRGAGQRIAIIELSSGFLHSDLEEYFKVAVGSPVRIREFELLHAVNPGVVGMGGTLDVSVAGTFAPDAEIDVYFAPNSDLGMIHALASILHDARYPLPDVISISYAGPELDVTAQFKTAFDEELRVAALLGITVCCSSGNGGQTAGKETGVDVDFPASSPHALACGGTDCGLISNGDEPETAWCFDDPAEGSGGGWSSFFPFPKWQNDLPMPQERFAGRGLPDVAGYAAGYELLVKGEIKQDGGTSAVAPLWAGLIAVLNQQLGANVGLIGPSLYSLPKKKGLTDITTGRIGTNTASPGWDPCTGLGTPHAAQLLDALQQL